MKAHEFYYELEKLLTRVGKGDKEISIKISDMLIPIKEIVWHEECDEFHIDADVDVTVITPELLKEFDKQDKSWLN